MPAALCQHGVVVYIPKIHCVLSRTWCIYNKAYRVYPPCICTATECCGNEWVDNMFLKKYALFIYGEIPPFLRKICVAMLIGEPRADFAIHLCWLPFIQQISAII